MQIGPIQLVVIGFANDDNFRGQIKAEIAAVRARGAIRLIDLLCVHKDDAGKVSAIRDSDLEGEAAVQYGAAVRKLLGIDGAGVASTATGGESARGIDKGGLLAIVEAMPGGSAAAFALFEHRWAAGLSASIREAGGNLIAQGILTRELVLTMGAELQAIAEAEQTIETAQAIKGAAVLDTLLFVDEVQSARAQVAAAVTTTVAAEVVRSLIVAGVIDDEEIEPALATLVTDGLLDVALVKGALAAAAASEAAVQELAAAQAGR